MTYRVRQVDAQRFRKLEIYDNSVLSALVVFQVYDERVEFLGNAKMDFERDDIRDVYEAINKEVLRFRQLATGTEEHEWIGNQWRHLLGWKLALRSFQSQLDKFQVQIDIRSGTPVTSCLTFPTIELDESETAFNRMSSDSITHFRVRIET